jgi:hypothetical protein
MSVTDSSALLCAAGGFSPWKDVHINSGDTRLSRWVQQSLDDLDATHMTIPVSDKKMKNLLEQVHHGFLPCMVEIHCGRSRCCSH